jgi:hypothetical protein
MQQLPRTGLLAWNNFRIARHLPGIRVASSGRVNAVLLAVGPEAENITKWHANAHDAGDWFSEAVLRSSGFRRKAAHLILREQS